MLKRWQLQRFWTSIKSSIVYFLDRRSSSGSSPSVSPRLSGKKLLEDGSLNDNSDDTCDKVTTVNGTSPRISNAHYGQASPKTPSSLATKSKNIEGKLNLIAPIAVTEELEVDDCETESETNEGRLNWNL